MPSLGPAEILVILVIALLVFGPDKMPEIARQVGKGMREFKRVQQHLRSELRDVVSEFDAPSGSEPRESDPVPMLPPKPDVVTPDAGMTPSPDPQVAPDADPGPVASAVAPESEPLSPPPPDLTPAGPPPADAMNDNGTLDSGTAETGTPAEPA